MTIDGDTGVGKVTVTKPVLTKTSDSSIHGQLYRVRVTVVGTSGSFEVVAGYFTAQNSAGDSYQPVLASVGQDLPSDITLTAGRRVRGYLGFDVPKGQTISSVTLVDGFNKPAGTWEWSTTTPSAKSTSKGSPAQQAKADRTAGRDLQGLVSSFEECNVEHGSYPTGQGRTAVTLTGHHSLPGCPDVTADLSPGTTARYYAAPGASTYVVTTENSSGGPNHFYCYNAARGGGVRAVTATSPDAC